MLYDAAHPVHGERDEISKWDARLKDYYGERVRLTLNGYVVEGKTGRLLSRIYIRRVRILESYSDMFGPGSMYAQALRVVRDRWSDADLRITSLTLELASEGDEDEENLGDD